MSNASLAWSYVGRARDRRTPAAEAARLADVVARPGGHVEQPLAEAALERLLARDHVVRSGRAELVVRLPRAAVLRRDQDDAVRRAGAVDRRRGRAFENLDILDVVGIHVDHAVRGGRALELAAVVLAAHAAAARVDRIEVRRRDGRVVDRNAVDDEQRLRLAVERAQAADLNLRRRTRISGLLAHDDVGRLRRQRLDDVRLVGLLHEARVDLVAHVAELLDLHRRARAGHHDFAELKRIRFEDEVLRDRAGVQRDARGLGLVAHATRREGDGRSRDTRAGDRE